MVKRLKKKLLLFLKLSSHMNISYNEAVRGFPSNETCLVKQGAKIIVQQKMKTFESSTLHA